jgi:imidazoleglycerol-phosphate dehydratase/histidinol-phosphatase
MLEQIAKNAGIGLVIKCEGDLEIDEHHTIEDVGIALGLALKQALGDKRGVGRYGFVLPMDEAQAQVAIDLSGRAYFTFDGKFDREFVGEMPTELVAHFFRSVSDSLLATLQMSVKGDNTHHMVETLFKGFGRALRPAIARGAGSEIPSTKGVL